MASYGDESIDSYLYSPYNPNNPYTPNPYSCRYLNPKPRGVSWRHKNYLAHYGDAEAHFDNQQRAHLKSILAQINPDLTPRLRKANTRDVGVQVNPKTDASVQCSLGPRTLVARKREALRREQANQSLAGPGSVRLASAGTVRYPRTLGVYSPIASRRLFSFAEPEKEEEDPTPAGQPPDRTPAAEPPEPGQKSAGSGEEHEAAAEDRPGGTAAGKADPEKSAEVKEEEQSRESEKKNSEDETKSKARVRFQFLEQKYGYYHCRDCNLRWESAYVWCVQGTNKVYFKQFCRTCQKAFNPYRVEDIACQACKRARCTCQVTLRHVDPKRPHRQDLCGRCKGKRLSCDSTFSFKYII